MEDLIEKKDGELLQKHACDSSDYLIAVACGAVSGLVDIFLVGAPSQSVIGKWTDAQVDEAVKKFAEKSGWSPRPGKEGNVASAIGYLERQYKVNYDQRYSADVGGAFNMSTKNHHIKSLSHSPDIIGLFFSVLNQFTSTSSFVSGGKLVTIKTESFELQGNNLVSKVFCGIVNWFGHIMSDVAGSSGSRGNIGRGSGVAIPFFELFQFCNFGKFNIGQDKQDLATLAVRAFQEGYDARFGIAMSLPVLLCELLVRFIWMIKQRFYFKKPLKECIPTQSHTDLRIMLLFGHGTLCLIKKTQSKTMAPKSKAVAGLLTLFLGLVGAQWFYLNKPVRAIVYLAITLLGIFVVPGAVSFWQLFLFGESIFFFVAKAAKVEKYSKRAIKHKKQVSKE